jgi:hypothetical protein
MVAVLRLGDADNTVSSVDAGTALPLYVDYVSVRASPARVVYSIPLPAGPVEDEATGAVTPGCTLAAGRDASLWNFNVEGFPSNTDNDALGIIPCYNVPVGATLDGASPKTIALVDRTAKVDTSRSGFISQVVRGEAAANDGWRQIASADGRRFYTSSVAEYDAGFRYIASPSTLNAEGAFVAVDVLSNSAGTLDARGIAMYGGKLYAVTGSAESSFNTIFQVGSSSPPTSTTSSYTKLKGMAALGGVWTFTFGPDANSVWAAVEKSSSPKGLAQLWRRSSSTASFAKVVDVTFDYSNALYVLTSRTEFGRTVLYGTSLGGLFRYDTAGVATGVRTAVRLLSAGAGTQFRGVMFAGAPVVSPSRSNTPTRTVTPTRSGTPTRSPASRTRTATRTATKSKSRKARK